MDINKNIINKKIRNKNNHLVLEIDRHKYKYLEFNKDLFQEFDKKFPKIILNKPEMSTFDNMLEFKSINQIL